MSIKTDGVKAMIGACLVAASAVGGCTTNADDAIAPALEVGAFDTKQIVTDGTWTMDAHQPVFDYDAATVTSSITFTNSSTGTRKAGACLLAQVVDSVNAAITCTADSQCATYIPSGSGGSAYCLAPNNSGTKTCWVRPGGQLAYCAGSPGISGAPAIGAGTWGTPTVGARVFLNGYPTTTWILEGCFSGCSGSTPTPSVSASNDEGVACGNDGRYWDGQHCYASQGDACAASGGYWDGGQCWESYAKYACESQPPDNSCTAYAYEDGGCQCLTW